MSTAAPPTVPAGPPDGDARAEIRALVGARPPGGHRPDLLVEFLHRLNDHWGGLHPQLLDALAVEMGLPAERVAEVAAGCPAFAAPGGGVPQAAITVRACQGVACRMAGAEALLAALPGLLAGPGLGIVPAGCLGRCDHAPAALVGQVPVPQATPEGVLNVVLQELERAPGDMALAHGATDFTGYDEYRAGGGYSLAAALVNGEESADLVLDSLEQSGLCSPTAAQPGGALVAARWRQVLAQDAPRVLVVNLSAAGPGQCKERELLERDPHRLLEGVLIAAQVAGCEAVFLALRDDYHDARELLRAELGLLLARPPCPLPHIELRRSAGGAIGGEPSALLESLQGRRPLPRAPVADGALRMFGRPVLVEQLETLHWVRDIVERGPLWFAGLGRRGHKGLRLFGVSGRVRRPGAKLAPAGISLRDLIEDHCGGMQDGHELYAWLPGGAGGGILPARLADLPLDFGTLQPYGARLGPAAVIVLSRDDRARGAALEMMRFVAAESCGQCTPCRVGSVHAARLLGAPRWDAGPLEDLNQMITDTSLCAIGRDAAQPVRCVQRYFRDEIG